MKALFIAQIMSGVSLLNFPLVAREAITTIRIPSVALEVQIVMDEGTMSREELILEGEAILNRNKDTTFIKIQFAESQAMLNPPLSMSSDVSTRGYWALEKRKWNTKNVRYAELISLRGNVVLRIRDGLDIKTIIVRGQNPLRVLGNSADLEFVQLGLKYDRRRTAVMWIESYAVVEKGRLDVDMAKRAAQAAQEVMGIPVGVHLIMREDRFSVFDPQFANSLLFDLHSPPEPEVWSKTPLAQCGVNPVGKGYCSTYRPSLDGWRRIEF